MPSPVVTDPSRIDPPVSRRWVPLSLRMFIILLALLGAVSACACVKWYRQQMAIRAIEAIGGRVGNNPTNPKWLRRWLGDARTELFENVLTVALWDTPVTDEDLVHIRTLDSVLQLSLDNTAVTDSGLADLKYHPGIEYLSLRNTKITDAGLVQLETMPELRHLWLDNTSVSDAGLAHLKGMTLLQDVSLNGTRVTEVGIAELRCALPDLKVER